MRCFCYSRRLFGRCHVRDDNAGCTAIQCIANFSWRIIRYATEARPICGTKCRRITTGTSTQATDAELAALAAVLAPSLQGLFGFHGDPSLNIVIHSATVDRKGADEGAESFHWHLEVLPRLSRPAGFEVGTGYTINSVVPEDVARWLRGEGG